MIPNSLNIPEMQANNNKSFDLFRDKKYFRKYNIRLKQLISWIGLRPQDGSREGVEEGENKEVRVKINLRYNESNDRGKNVYADTISISRFQLIINDRNERL